MELKNLAKDCLEYVRSIEKSYSHGVRHSKDVLNYAMILQKEYGGNKKVIIIASLLHDVSRHFGASGTNQGKEKIDVIKKFLDKLKKKYKLNDNEIEKIIESIKYHSIKNINKKLCLEAKIVSDADSLAGFGIKGIIRIAMYAGERAKDFGYIRKKICIDMKTRERNLYLKKSKRIARKLNKNIKKLLDVVCKNEWPRKGKTSQSSLK